MIMCAPAKPELGAPVGCTSSGEARSTPRVCPLPMVPALRRPVQHRRGQQHLLPTATESAVESWAAQPPPGFVYSLKLGSFGSHRMKLSDAQSWLPNHLDRLDRLGAAVGPTLVQLPPKWHRNAARLDEFLSVTPLGRRWAVELREPSWLNDDIYEVLRRHGTALCVHDLLADHHPWELAADWTYVRFHGPNALEHPYQGQYGGRRLYWMAERLGSWLAQGVDVYAYFNNDDPGLAVNDALWLAQRLEQTPHLSPG